MCQEDIVARLGEQAAAEYLERALFSILHRDCRCAGSRIDIVAAGRRLLGRAR